MEPDWDALVGVVSPVDEEHVLAEVAEYATGAVPEVRREPWTIRTVGEADWAMRRLADVERRTQEYDDQIALWTDARDRVKRAGEFFVDRLKEWALASRTKDRRTFPLAHGVVATRESKARFAIDDDETVVAWAKERHPGVVRVVESVNVTGLSSVGVRVAEAVVAFVVVDKETGETVTRGVHVDRPLLVGTDRADAARAALIDALPDADRYAVTVETEQVVVDADGGIVPGVVLVPAKITATVTPSGL